MLTTALLFVHVLLLGVEQRRSLQSESSAAIPATGIAILDGGVAGGAGGAALLFCVWPGDEDVDEDSDLGFDAGSPKSRRTIAGQCCTSTGACRRRATSTAWCL